MNKTKLLVTTTALCSLWLTTGTEAQDYQSDEYQRNERPSQRGRDFNRSGDGSFDRSTSRNNNRNTSISQTSLPVREANKATQLLGATVKNEQGEELGTIEDIVIDLERDRVAYAVLEYRDKLIPVPVSSLQVGDDGSTIIAPAARVRLDRVPGFTANEWPDLRNPDISSWNPESRSSDWNATRSARAATADPYYRATDQERIQNERNNQRQGSAGRSEYESQRGFSGDDEAWSNNRSNIDNANRRGGQNSNAQGGSSSVGSRTRTQSNEAYSQDGDFSSDRTYSRGERNRASSRNTDRNYNARTSASNQDHWNEQRNNPVFKGKIVAIDPEQRTMTVEGESGTRDFIFAERPTLALKDNRNPRLVDLRVGFPVSVGYQAENGTSVAHSVIRTDTPEVR